MKFKSNILFRPKVIGIGVDIGNNHTYRGKWSNLFISITLLFWTFEADINWKPSGYGTSGRGET